MKHEVVRPQAGNVTLRVEAGERVIEVVRQEDSFDPRLLQALIFPVRLGHLRRRLVVQSLPVVGSDPVVCEPEKLAA